MLFPGKTQYVGPDDDAPVVESLRILDSVNPLSWGRCAKAIIDWKPDLTIACWWMSFFGPSMGSVVRRLKNKGLKVIGLLHNAIPHEPHFWDRPLTRYFLDGCDSLVTLSAEVQSSLAGLGYYRSRQLFHPVYPQFGKAVPRAEAENALGLNAGGKNLLFFGLIRKYKGLDLLIRAFGMLPEDYNLIIAGEPYGSFDEYSQLIAQSPAAKRIRCFLGYVSDSEVKKYFSAADLSVLPYRSASQSGVMAVSYNFRVPMAVTDTGSLKQEIENAGTGVVSKEISAEAMAECVRSYFETPGLQEKCRQNIEKELERLSWSNFCKAFLEYAETT